MDISLKIRLHSFCQELLEEKIKEARTIIEEIQLAANQETKSSAGDKYETGRAMLQQEQDKYGRQLMEALKQKSIFDQLKPEIVMEKVQPGCLVATSGGAFYVAASLGSVRMEGREYVVISSAAPLYKQLSGISKGQEVTFNNKRILVEAVV